jgi:hypothetical protein
VIRHLAIGRMSRDSATLYTADMTALLFVRLLTLLRIGEIPSELDRISSKGVGKVRFLTTGSALSRPSHPLAQQFKYPLKMTSIFAM